MRNPGERPLAAIAAGLAALVLGACAAAAPAEKAPGFDAVAVEQRPLDVKVEASGTLQPPLIVEVKSKASGQVLKLFAQTGDEVKTGQPPPCPSPHAAPPSLPCGGDVLSSRAISPSLR